MNQVYLGSKATASEDGDEAPDISAIDTTMKHVVSTFPGFHLPHVWVAKDGHSSRVSTLDLCGRGNFTILTGIGGESWQQAARSVQSERPGLDLKVISIGWRQDYMDAYREWTAVRGVEDDGAVLVRPDCFVAWRCKRIPANATETLRKVFLSIVPPKVQES